MACWCVKFHHVDEPDWSCECCERDHADGTNSYAAYIGEELAENDRLMHELQARRRMEEFHREQDRIIARQTEAYRRARQQERTYRWYTWPHLHQRRVRGDESNIVDEEPNRWIEGSDE